MHAAFHASGRVNVFAFRFGYCCGCGSAHGLSSHLYATSTLYPISPGSSAAKDKCNTLCPVKFSSALDASPTVAALWYPVLQYTPHNPPFSNIQPTTSLTTSPNSSWQKTALTVKCDSTETLVLSYRETKKLRCVFDFVEAISKVFDFLYFLRSAKTMKPLCAITQQKLMKTLDQWCQ